MGGLLAERGFPIADPFSSSDGEEFDEINLQPPPPSPTPALKKENLIMGPVFSWDYKPKRPRTKYVTMQWVYARLCIKAAFILFLGFLVEFLPPSVRMLGFVAWCCISVAFLVHYHSTLNRCNPINILFRHNFTIIMTGPNTYDIFAPLDQPSLTPDDISELKPYISPTKKSVW
jgi:hypothetical protein